jgi:superfamily II DNA or RNA helicase
VGFLTEQFKLLRNALSYTETTRSRFSGFGSVRKYLIDKSGNFPTGLLYLVEETLKSNGIEYTVQDTRIRPKTRAEGAGSLMVGLDKTPRPEQAEAPEVAFQESRGIVVAPTGCGKSLIAALILDRFQVRSMIVVPSLGLKKQLTEDLKKVFGDEMVGPLYRGRARHLFTVENIDQLDPKCPVPGIDLVLIDEFHHSGAKSYRELNMKAWKDVYFKFGLTATPFRSKSEERLLLESVLSKVIYQIPYKTALDKGYVCPFDAFYIDLPAVKLKCSGEKWHSVYKELVVDRADRNQIICDLIENLKNGNKSTLVLLKQVEHGLKIEFELQKRGVRVPFAKGENDNNESLISAFNERIEEVLMGTSVIGEGIDTRPTEYCVLAGGGKSKNQFMQNVGRLFRLHPTKERGVLILFRDPSHKWTLEHFKAQVKYLKEEYGIVPAKLEL